MKYYILIALTIIFISCETLEITSSEDNLASFSATINGESWIAGTSNGAHAPVLTEFSDGAIQVEGYLNKSTSQKETLLIKIENDFNGVGTYNQKVVGYYFIDSQDNYQTYSSENFTITIAEYDGQKASGTFTGEVYNDNEIISITNGVFKDLNIENF